MKLRRGSALGRSFGYFRKILDLNNKVLEEIAEAEKILGGDYLFDSSYLVSFVTRVCEDAREVVYNLNSLSGARHLVLYDKLDQIRFTLEDLLAGGEGPMGERLVVSMGELDRDCDGIAGTKMANLADLARHFQVKVPDGFVITVRAYRIFLEENRILERIGRLYGAGAGRDDMELWAEIQAIVEEASIPDRLRKAVEEGLSALFASKGGPFPLAVRSSAVGEEAEHAIAGKGGSSIGVGADKIFSAYKRAVSIRFKPQVVAELGGEAGLEEHPVAVAVQEMVDQRLMGAAWSKDPLGQERGLMVITASSPVAKSQGGQNGRPDGPIDRFLCERIHPFRLVSSNIAQKQEDTPLPTGERPIEPSKGRLRRGSGLLDSDMLAELAETVMLCEKAFGTPREMEWAVDVRGRLVILLNRRLGVEGHAEPEVPLEEAVEGFPVLLDGLGQTAHFGVASGPVVFVDPEGDLDHVPVGAILVSRFAHPRLSRALRRAGALITDVGSVTGHLATIAREFRVPSILGTGKATSVLEDGMEVTVDAGERKVYRGVVRHLLEHEAGQEWQYLDEPEVRLLRRLLSLVAPLYLVDPGSKEFRAENCRTIHDIIHFCHEKAVESLIETFASYKVPSDGEERVYTLEVPLPIRIEAIDIGGGISAPEGGGVTSARVGMERVTSLPLKALLEGLALKEAWDREPAAFGLGDLLSSMARPVNMLTRPPEYAGRNLAIVASDYAHLSLLLGYHFNVIDSYLSQEPDNNYVYFRFAGGFAQEDKRLKRAELIRWILDGLGFKCELNRDVVIGKLKGMEAHRLASVLKLVGVLVAFTRQLDVLMTDDKAVEQFYRRFLALAAKDV